MTGASPMHSERSPSTLTPPLAILAGAGSGFRGKPEDAIESLNKAIRLDPRNRDFYLV